MKKIILYFNIFHQISIGNGKVGVLYLFVAILGALKPFFDKKKCCRFATFVLKGKKSLKSNRQKKIVNQEKSCLTNAHPKVVYLYFDDMSSSNC